MGAKDSKRSCLPYEDAVKRMSEEEYKRICEAFKRLSGGNQLLSKQSFILHVLGDGVPQAIAEWLYLACGGTPRGIALKDLVCGLVLLTKGKQDEKIRFLFTLYCNDSGTHITRSEFYSALQTEGTLPPDKPNRPNILWERTMLSLFPVGQDRVTYEHFSAWIQYNKEATILSKWLLSNPCVSLSSEVEAPTFYQTLAGVTHLEEQDICELEKCFWTLQGSSPSCHLDLNCVRSMVCPPIPLTACEGLFLALDVNRDGHIDFKELCCGISAACRGPIAERMKFCFKIFDMDRDCYLNPDELQHMIHTLMLVANENNKRFNGYDGNFDSDKEEDHSKILQSLTQRLDERGGLSQEEFLVWGVEDNGLVEPMLELLFQVCHVSFVLRPACRHHEHDIVTGWLEREERRGYHVGQFWYLISSEWWQNWLSYTTAPRNNLDHCTCRTATDPRLVEEGIVCDESLISNGTDSNEFNSNSMESMGDLLGKGDTCSIASSSGVSSSSGTTGSKRSQGMPGPIDNSNLVAEPLHKVRTLTGEGGRLKRDTPLVQHRDFELVPDSLWKALAHWYGGPLPLPRQVILPPGSCDVELELYPLNLSIWMHQSQAVGSAASWSSVVGGYGAAALNTAGITTSPISSPRRYLAHTAAFSRLANVRQVIEFLCLRLSLRVEDVRLWHIRDTTTLLEDENATLQDLSVIDGDKILLEVRNKDLTWPEELGALVAGGQTTLSAERRPTICLPPGATGLHNLGNTCFMNAALQAVSNTRPLTLYFQRDGQLCELNSVNPLGTKGMVARRYAELCRELWAGSTRSVAPLKLRYCVTKHAPHLGGGGQHDSQELLAWLLDALHEDLNRVARKQYSELKDSGGRPDEVVAEEAWVQHLARDHSIITDLFYGQLKSKVTCQTCGHESVRFDPFNLLSLPLPMESYTLCEVLVVRLNGETPIKYGLRLNSEAKYIELKQQLERLCNIKTERLLLAELAYSQIRQVLNDDVRINPGTATELYAYELPEDHQETEEISNDVDVEVAVSDSPLARSPENRQKTDSHLMNGGVVLKKASIISHSFSDTSSTSSKFPSYLIALHRKCVRQETYFLSQQKSKPSLFGSPLLLGFRPNSTCQSLYEAVWGQVTRFLSPLPQSDQTNHATDCDDSLGYEFPFTLKAVLQGGQICAICHWTQFCRGCTLPCSNDLVVDHCRGNLNGMCIAIDWDPTALHLRYQSNREKLWIEDESVSRCQKLHTEPIDLDNCLKAFTSEERLETKYHCSNCQDKQPATKKLQIWRLPPILIIHLKRFDCVNNKWVKTQKVVNFPFKDFDPTAYLASVPQETILRHLQLREKRQDLESSCDSQTSVKTIEESTETNCTTNEHSKLLTTDNKPKVQLNKVRARLESTSLLKTPIIDEHLKDYHQHKLLPGQDPFDLKYQLYAVVSHSGMLNGGHYISYACNPNGNWYCYNDSSCREVLTEIVEPVKPKKSTCTPLRRRKNTQSSEKEEETCNTDPKETTCDDTTVTKPEPNYKKCAYSDVKTPKIDTSSAYILFYERSGLDYKPYLPEVVSNGQIVPEVELDENESELRKQLCSIQ
ncbi:ubiquitin carboxyl-terminal hydrolase 32 isoform X2 [Tribolium castaneum]|uniref:ubiquitinyl hydrolase 1 n=1 Tax=Tribolium castaneum TaxID=7070 RepID=A0A139WGI4_TRICA|nr:PREDICTED: ubiquitin carboxyl-terminal hydrolase 32 isoform X2 [Tribolium castaneum]KYB26971.1 Ubiquitin carboxyl-terminal hydrolase 32-like Protein [Tribolium castaneum]|eukprot:XP_008194795.1 PREDICTED: ubiquitin carboxyl-terminal hydrolase 32 isoform X2 [Tribolium castaneum]